MVSLLANFVISATIGLSSTGPGNKRWFKLYNYCFQHALTRASPFDDAVCDWAQSIMLGAAVQGKQNANQSNSLCSFIRLISFSDCWCDCMAFYVFFRAASQDQEQVELRTIDVFWHALTRPNCCHVIMFCTCRHQSKFLGCSQNDHILQHVQANNS